ncbi:cadherin-17 [Genypterus blacodes]|uniref:cadherin-17 n=1 Tax=Genypterus blacodes TaxID=154954 RepID=UPI003F76367C
MTPAVHLLLLPLLFSIADGKGLEEKKGPIKDTTLDVPEATLVPYAIYQFVPNIPGVTSFRLTGEGSEAIMISDEGWLFLDKPLDWAQSDHYIISLEALVGDEVVEGPAAITINVVDINNHAPAFNQSDYPAVVRERNPAGIPFTRVFASDRDDPESPNAHLSYSLVMQIPNTQNTLFFQIDAATGEISTTEEGAQMLRARESLLHSRGEASLSDTLKKKFDEFCTPTQEIPYELNPFYTCVEKAEVRRSNVNPLEDPDFTLLVRVQDLGGASDNALSANARVDIVVQQNLWTNPGPITIREQLKTQYPYVIAKVQSNDISASYRLVQKLRELEFPFAITEEGEIQLLKELDREEKDMYILVVMAEDPHGNEVDPPMEILVLVEDVNDNHPMCEQEETVFEVQENESVGSTIGHLVAHDDDEAGTLNALLTYTILSQEPPTSPANAFSIDDASGQIQALRSLQRKDAAEYRLAVRVNDPGFSTECQVIIKVIDINNMLPLFEKNDYGTETLSEDTPVGHTVLEIQASDADDAGSGSSRIEFQISAGDDDGVFAIETDGSGVGRLVVAKPLDFESSQSYELKIEARNPEPLMAGLEYGSESTASVSVSVTDVDEAPEITLDIQEVTVPENITLGATLFTVEAKDPEGKEISFKMDGDANGWLEIDAATGAIKAKDKLDRETLEAFDVTVTAFEKENPEMFVERVVSVRLLDVNDNIPKLTESQAFICVKKPEPIILKAVDGDSVPYGQPFTFVFARGKSLNWDLQPIDGSSARLTLKKVQTEDKTFPLSIVVKDNAGVGVAQKFDVRVCNCTELGYCYMAPEARGFTIGLGGTIGILGGTLGFCVIAFFIVMNGIKKDNKKKAEEAADKNEVL